MPPTTQPAKRGRPPVLEPQRKQLILNFVHEYQALRHISPTYTEIAKGIGYSKTAGGSVFTLVEQLISEGWLRRVQPGSRTLLPTMPYTDVYHEITDVDLLKVAKRQKGLKILS